MSAYGSIAIQTGLNNGNDSSKVLQTNKTSLALGGIYKFPGRYILFYDTKLYVDVTLSAANDKGRCIGSLKELFRTNAHFQTRFNILEDELAITASRSSRNQASLKLRPDTSLLPSTF